MSVYAKNKEALFNYTVLEKFEAGIKLLGPEVKSVKAGQVNLKGSYVTLREGELQIVGMHIAPYAKATNLKDYNPTRSRKLLVHKSELTQLAGKLTQQGLTIVVLSIYGKENLIKVEIALVSGKKKSDKRASIKARETTREIARAVKERGL